MYGGGTAGLIWYQTIRKYLPYHMKVVFEKVQYTGYFILDTNIYIMDTTSFEIIYIN